MVSPTYRQIHQDGFEIPTAPAIRARWEEQMAERAHKVLDQIGVESGKAGIHYDSLHVFGDAPYESIVDAAKNNHCDVIVMGSHGYGGFKQFIVGSETTRVLSHTKIPVLVCR